MTTDLNGLRVLLVEDSPVVAPYTESLLAELGCVVVGPAANLATARELAQSAEIDAAMVDVHIRGERVFAICDILQSRGIPFVLTSGYAGSSAPEKWRDHKRLAKPYGLEDVERALRELLGQGQEP